MSALRVSIILPVLNAAKTIGAAIASIRCQTFPDWELIVVDDGSGDGSLELVRNIARTEPRIRVMAHAHCGIVETLNAALSQARGPLIARMDADDESHPSRLSEQITCLEQHPGLGLVSSLVRFGGDPTSAAGYALHVDWLNTLVEPESIYLQRFIESPLAHPSVMFRRELIDRFGGYETGPFPEDYELWLRWLDHGVRMSKVPKVLFTWNDSPGRLSRHDHRYNADGFYRCKGKYLARWIQRQIDPARTVLVWGAGRVTRNRAEHLVPHGVSIGGYIDIDPRKVGKVHDDRRVIAPQELPEPRSCFVLGYVAKRGARELARSFLTAKGFVEGRDFLIAA